MSGSPCSFSECSTLSSAYSARMLSIFTAWSRPDLQWWQRRWRGFQICQKNTSESVGRLPDTEGNVFKRALLAILETSMFMRKPFIFALSCWGGSLSQSILEKTSRMVAHVRPLDHVFHESREMLLLKEPYRSFQKYTIGWSWAVGWPDAALRICKSDMRKTNLRCLDCVWSCEEQILPVVFGRLP